MPEVPTRRPVADRIEIAAPSLAAIAARLAGHLPVPLRRRVLVSVLARAAAAFNRCDYDAVFALLADSAHYVPPPALSQVPITGRNAILDFWRATNVRFATSTVTNVSLDETLPEPFTRTLRITHRADGEEFSYLIRQVTDLPQGRVVSQVNDEIE
jgi:SnoaL-like domain